jgi:hypothetical protein
MNNTQTTQYAVHLTERAVNGTRIWQAFIEAFPQVTAVGESCVAVLEEIGRKLQLLVAKMPWLPLNPARRCYRRGNWLSWNRWPWRRGTNFTESLPMILALWKFSMKSSDFAISTLSLARSRLLHHKAMRYLLDSNILRYYTAKDPTMVCNLARVPAEQIGIPFIVVIEQLRGRFDAYLKAEPDNLIREQSRLLAAQQILSHYQTVYVDEQSVATLQRFSNVCDQPNPFTAEAQRTAAEATRRG